MPAQGWSFRMAVAAVWLCLLSLLSPASAQEAIYCSDINNSNFAQPNYTQFQSYGSCSQFCTAEWPELQPNLYAFGILQGHNCWCSNYFPAGGNLTSGCDQPCPGFGANICGSADLRFYTYDEIGQVQPSGTAGAAGSSASSTTAASVTVTAAPSSSTSDDSSSSETSLSNSDSTSTTATPIISIYTSIGQTHTVTVTPSSPANSKGLTQESSSGGLGTGGAVGLTIGLVALIAIIAGLVWFYFRRKRQQEAEEFNASRRGSSAGLGGPIPSRTMSENSRYVLGTDGRQVVETWEPGDAPGSRRSKLMPVDPRLDPFAPVYQRGDNKSRESVNTLRDDHDYSRRVVNRGPILRATNPDHPED